MNATFKTMMFAGLVMAEMATTAWAAPRGAGSKIEGTAGMFDNGGATAAYGYAHRYAPAPVAAIPAAPNANRLFSVAPAQQPATAMPTPTGCMAVPAAPATVTPAPAHPTPAARAAQPTRQFSYAPQAQAPVTGYQMQAATAAPHTWSFGVRDAGSKIKGNL